MKRKEKETVRLDALKPNPRNPRTITPEAMARLCESVRRDPQFLKLRPIVVDGDGVILGGNMRYQACLKNGMTEVPACWVVTANNLTAEQRKRFILMDNAPDGMSGEWDAEILKEDYEIPELSDIGMDLAELGIETGGALIPSGNKSIDEAAMADTENECPKCGFQW